MIKNKFRFIISILPLPVVTTLLASIKTRTSSRINCFALGFVSVWCQRSYDKTFLSFRKRQVIPTALEIFQYNII